MTQQKPDELPAHMLEAAHTKSQKKAFAKVKRAEAKADEKKSHKSEAKKSEK
jgi:hypothetical protein